MFTDFFLLAFWIYPRVLWFSFCEEKKVKRDLYSKSDLFHKVDQRFFKFYRLKNPYRIVKNYRKKNKLAFPDSYGETPLTVFQDIFLKGNLSSKDTFIDLGCGRGRGLFLASSFWKCASIGIDHIPFFCSSITSLAKDLSLPIQAFCEERHQVGSWIKKGTFFYLYSLCIEDKEWESLISVLEKIKPHSILVTVDLDLLEHTPSFRLLSTWDAMYPWGEATLFLYKKIEKT